MDAGQHDGSGSKGNGGALAQPTLGGGYEKLVFILTFMGQPFPQGQEYPTRDAALNAIPYFPMNWHSFLKVDVKWVPL